LTLPNKVAAGAHRWRLPLATQLIGLVVVSLMAAITVHAAVALLIPPPPPEVYRMGEIATALREPGREVSSRNGHTLTAVRTRVGSVADIGQDRPVRLEQWLTRELATQMSAPETSVRVILPQNGHAFGRRYVRTMRSQLPFGPSQPPPGAEGRPPGPPPAITPGASPSRPPELLPPDDLGGRRRVHPGPGDDEHDRLHLHGDPFIIAPFIAEVRQGDGSWSSLNVRETAPFADWRQRVLLGFALSVLLLCPLAYLFARGLAAPIAGFARAAERLGRDPGAPPLEVKGPAEIAAAALAFNQMQDRISRYVQDRTALIGSVAHDLRTPLTRLRFRIEQAPEPLRNKLASDIDEMESMIAATLAFVRDASQPAARQSLELRALVGAVVAEMSEVGAPVRLVPGKPLQIEADALGLRRVVANLVANAVKFGTEAHVRVGTDAQGTHALIEVDDNGPGLPEGDLDRMFEPFVRVEASRNRETGGAGLGLAVVRTVARAHGGDAALLNRAEGGLRARVTLPLGADNPMTRN
jgi:signal transduction histidine kinase